jgi:hypothetical protein
VAAEQLLNRNAQKQACRPRTKRHQKEAKALNLRWSNWSQTRCATRLRYAPFMFYFNMLLAFFFFRSAMLNSFVNRYAVAVRYHGLAQERNSRP